MFLQLQVCEPPANAAAAMPLARQSTLRKDVGLGAILESHPLIVRRRLAVRCLDIVTARLCMDTLVHNGSISKNKGLSRA